MRCFGAFYLWAMGSGTCSLCFKGTWRLFCGTVFDFIIYSFSCACKGFGYLVLILHQTFLDGWVLGFGFFWMILFDDDYLLMIYYNMPRLLVETLRNLLHWQWAPVADAIQKKKKKKTMDITSQKIVGTTESEASYENNYKHHINQRLFLYYQASPMQGVLCRDIFARAQSGGYHSLTRSLRIYLFAELCIPG